jgi:radical SAM protein with 4Fe4S-binding SPASM domain
MPVELRPLGVSCNIACQYCYQNPQREAGNVAKSYDIELMKAAVEREGGPFALFGGEPLLLPEHDLETLWSWGFERYGTNSVQTNGTLIRDAHIRLFKKYNVNVGISIDGPGPLNDVRWVGSLEATRKSTARTERAIELICEAGIAPSLIVTLHNINAQAAQLETMNEWFRRLDLLGIKMIRLHILESENAFIRETYGLSTSENIAAFLNFARLEKTLARVKFDLFRDIEQLLLGNDEGAACVWAACDPYTTAAVRGVEGHGQRSNCGRTNKDGVDFVKGDAPGFERYLALYHTDQAAGGCAGCRFFLMCKGQCPGTAIDGDWRNRSEHCEVWKALFEHIEGQLVDSGRFALSLDPDRERVEDAMVGAWMAGRNPRLRSLV